MTVRLSQTVFPKKQPSHCVTYDKKSTETKNRIDPSRCKSFMYSKSPFQDNIFSFYWVNARAVQGMANPSATLGAEPTLTNFPLSGEHGLHLPFHLLFFEVLCSRFQKKMSFFSLGKLFQVMCLDKHN